MVALARKLKSQKTLARNVAGQSERRELHGAEVTDDRGVDEQVGRLGRSAPALGVSLRMSRSRLRGVSGSLRPLCGCRVSHSGEAIGLPSPDRRGTRQQKRRRQQHADRPSTTVTRFVTNGAASSVTTRAADTRMPLAPATAVVAPTMHWTHMNRTA